MQINTIGVNLFKILRKYLHTEIKEIGNRIYFYVLQK